ncbi:MAG: hypothetical protein M1380_11625 [Chloroflexi bacterium]|nr:hypothetical protein [Chloroflexota bacterium]
MPAKIWTLSRLSDEDERLLKEAEATLGGKVLLAYEPDQVAAARLNESQLECLQGLEQKLGMAVVAVEPAA